MRELNPAQRHEQSIAELGQGSSGAITRTNQHIRKSIDEAVERLLLALTEAKREYGIEIEWRCVDGVASILVAQHARFADLCILSQDVPADLTATGYTFSEELLFVAGRPVISVNDALPLIEHAEQVTVLAVNRSSTMFRQNRLRAQCKPKRIKWAPI